MMVILDKEWYDITTFSDSTKVFMSDIGNFRTEPFGTIDEENEDDRSR